MADRIEELRNQLRDALVEEGIMDAATAEAVLLPARGPAVEQSGNLADLMRMGSIASQGVLRTPPGEDDVETSNIEDAFVENPPAGRPEDDPAYVQANEGAQAGAMQQATVEPTVEAEAPGGTEGAAPEEGAATEGGLESMTKAELQEEANRRGVAVTTSMTKQEMIDALGGA